MQCRVCPALDPTPIGPWGVVAGVGVTTIVVASDSRFVPNPAFQR